jgi:hypothetical protein
LQPVADSDCSCSFVCFGVAYRCRLLHQDSVKISVNNVVSLDRRAVLASRVNGGIRALGSGVHRRLRHGASLVSRLRSRPLAVRSSSGVRAASRSRRFMRVSVCPQWHSKEVLSDRQSFSWPRRISASPHLSHSRTTRPEHSTKRSSGFANDRMCPPVFFRPWQTPRLHIRAPSTT